MRETVLEWVHTIQTLVRKETFLHVISLVKTTYRKTTIAVLAVFLFLFISADGDPPPTVGYLVVWWFCALVATGFIGYGIQKYGTEKFLELCIDRYFTVLFGIGKYIQILISLPIFLLSWLWDIFVVRPLRFLFEQFPSKLPAVFFPFYFTLLNFIGCAGIYALFLFDSKGNQQGITTIKIAGYSFGFISSALSSAGSFFFLFEFIIVLMTIFLILEWMHSIQTKATIMIRW